MKTLRIIRQEGFTLVELLVVLVITGILASVAYPAYTRFLNDGKATQAQAIIGAIAAAEKVERQLNTTFVMWINSDDDSVVSGSPTLYYASIAASFTAGHDGCYKIGSTLIDVGEAPDFEFCITTLTASTFVVRARGCSGGLDSNDWLEFDYSATRNPRVIWSANPAGSLTAP